MVEESKESQNSEAVQAKKKLPTLAEVVAKVLEKKTWLDALNEKDSNAAKLVLYALQNFDKWQRDFNNTVSLLMKIDKS